MGRRAVRHQSGQALDERKVEVRIRFNAVAGAVKSVSRCAPNELIVRVQPDESIYWKVQSKAPGLDFHIEQQRMDLMYNKDRKREMPEAYERLILEVARLRDQLCVGRRARGSVENLHARAEAPHDTESPARAVQGRLSRGPVAADRRRDANPAQKAEARSATSGASRWGVFAAMHNSLPLSLKGHAAGPSDLGGSPNKQSSIMRASALQCRPPRACLLPPAALFCVLSAYHATPNSLPKACLSEFRVPGITRERNGVPDVLDARDQHDEALESENPGAPRPVSAQVRVLAQVRIPPSRSSTGRDPSHDQRRGSSTSRRLRLATLRTADDLATAGRGTRMSIALTVFSSGSSFM